MNTKGRVVMKTVLKMTFFIFVLMLCSLIVIQPISADNIRKAPELKPIWDKLDAARQYRKNWRGTSSPTPHSDLIANYKDNPVSAYEPKTPQQLFVEAAWGDPDATPEPILGFNHYLADSTLKEEATWGLQESVNEYLAGQMLLGNDYLIKGLRTRFPTIDDKDEPDENHLTKLTKSAEKFQAGIDVVVDSLRENHEIMRTGGTENTQFPFWVENSVKADKTRGELLECEMYRFTNIVERAAMASNSKAKRMFFFDNVNDVDNHPYGNFPGLEDLDINSNDVQDKAGREDSAREFKRSAHATYLHTALLAAVQTEKEFSQNNGYQLKRQIVDAQKVFDDIKSGFNPLLLLGDYIPHQAEGAYYLSVQKLLGRARSEVHEAIIEENEASQMERRYDQDKTALQDTLRNMQEQYLDRIDVLTGIPKNNILSDYDLSDPDERESLYAKAKENAETGLGQMGIQKLLMNEAARLCGQADEAFRQYPEKIRIEQDRNYQIAQLTLKNGNIFAALSFSEQMLNSWSITLGCPPKFQFNPNELAVAGIRSARDILTAMQQADIGNINTDAAVKKMLLDQAMAAISVELAVANAQIKNAQYNELEAELKRTVANYIASQEDMLDAYFANPAYRLERDKAIDEAEESFAAAMEKCFYATKALEYLWSEKFNNPVMVFPMLISLPPGADEFVRAESVFSSKFASDLDDFLDALWDWDTILRDHRTPPGGDLDVTISVKNDILGFKEGDEEYNTLLFRDFIKKNRVEGLNPDKPDLIFDFPLEIGDEKLFTDHPNIKITGISVDLVSIPARLILDENYSSGFALVDLFMCDKANIRTFFADYPVDDDILTYDLSEGRILKETPFQATVQGTFGGWPNPPEPNDQLAGHSPAVTRLILRIKMNRGNNQYLILENLGDIKITIYYHFGIPPDVTFPSA